MALIAGTTAASRLGFRGSEDLSSGLSAGFWLESTLNSDTGTLGGNAGQRGNVIASSFFNLCLLRLRRARCCRATKYPAQLQNG